MMGPQRRRDTIVVKGWASGYRKLELDAFVAVRWELSANDAISDQEPIQPHQAGRNVGLPWDGEYRLTHATFLQQLQDSRAAPRIELGEWIVEQQNRIGA